MLAVLAAQAAAEYVGIVAQDMVGTITMEARRLFSFLQTPQGVFIVLAVVLLLAFTIGRRRRF